MGKIMKIETKEFDVKSVAVDGSPLYLEGYVGAFGNVDSHGDVLLKGAAAGQVGATIHCRYWHGDNIGAMLIDEEDAYGIKVRVNLYPEEIMPESMKGLNGRLRWEMDSGIKYKMSIGYITEASSYDAEDTGVFGPAARRILKKIRLVEGSILTLASNDRAVITSYKSAGLTLDTIATMSVRDIERELKEGRPFSNELAKMAASLLKQDKGAPQDAELKGLQSLLETLKKAAKS